MNKKNRLIGVCGANLFEQNSIQFLSALKEISLKAGYNTVAFSSCLNSLEDVDDAYSEKQLLDLCKYVNLDCIIILTETLKNTELLNYIVEIGKLKNIPVFSIDGTIDGCYNMPMDYNSGFRHMVRHIITDHGVSRVNMLAGMKGNSFSEERVDIYKEVLQECGIPFEQGRLEYGDFWSRPARAALERFFNSGLELPEAIICANDAMAITACSFLSECNLRVPEDVIVTGFDGTESAFHHYPSMTTCAPDYEEAIDFIMEQTRHVRATGKVTPCDHKINFVVMKRQSCGCQLNTIQDNSKIISSLYEDVGDCSWHTIAMNSLVTNLLNKDRIEDIVHLLPGTVHLWSDHFRFACIKSDLLSDDMNLSDFKENESLFGNMTTILQVKDHIFAEDLYQFDVKDFIPDFDKLTEQSGKTFVVRILKNGKQAYGYTVDEFRKLEHRQLQRCNEFAMFLTHCINTVLHNYELNKLNRDLERAYEDIAILSDHDPMTGLLNRRGFFKTLNELLSEDIYQGRYLYVVNVDLDRLKYINDTFGHSEGDFAITTVAHSLLKIQAENLICSRFGGDEFTCTFFASAPDTYDTSLLKSEITDIIQTMPDVDKKEYPLDFSIGLSCRLIENDINVESIISSADQKMYADKATKKRRRTDYEN